MVVCCCYCCITQHFCVCLALFGYSCNYFQLRFYVSVLLLFSCPPTLAHCCAQLLLFITTCHKVERYYATFCYCSSLQSFAINNNNNNVLAITTAITHSVMRNARRFHLRSEEKLLIAGTSKRQHPHTHIHIHICEHIKNLLHFSRFTRTWMQINYASLIPPGAPPLHRCASHRPYGIGLRDACCAHCCGLVISLTALPTRAI